MIVVCGSFLDKTGDLFAIAGRQNGQNLVLVRRKMYQEDFFL